MQAHLDFFYFLGSTYSYLSIMRIESMAARAGVQVRWRPFYVRAIMTEQNNIPFRDKPVKAAYMWRDVERRAQRLGIDWAGIPPYPVDKDGLASRIGVVSALEGWAPAFAGTACRRWFIHHEDFGERGVAAEIVRATGQEPERVLARAETGEIRQQLADETDAARRLGIFGSPTFAVGKEIFWGDDRLEEAIEWAQVYGAEGARGQ